MEQTTKKEMVSVTNCPLCGHSNHQLFLKTKDYFLTGEEFSLVQCDHCSFIYTNPVPSEASVFAYYDSPEYSSHDVKKPGLFNRVYKKARQINIRKKYKITIIYKKTGSLLDVGCGTGELLKYFRDKDWETIGIEPVSKAREYAVKENKLTVYPEKKLQEFPDSRFDVISMWHVLEHVYKLNERMDELRRILKPDGTLMIAVPMINSFDAGFYGSYWAALDVPRHLYHFTEKTLKELVKKHGMHVTDSYPMKMDAYYVSLLSERYQKTPFPHLKAILTGFKSNRKAAHSGIYSSMIFAIKKN